MMPGVAVAGCPVCNATFSIQHGPDARPGFDANQKARKAVQNHVREVHGLDMSW